MGKIAKTTRSKVTRATADGVKNVEVHLWGLAHHPDVEFHMLHLQLKSLPVFPPSTKGSSRIRKIVHESSATAVQKQSGGQRSRQRAHTNPRGLSIKFVENKNKRICMKVRCWSLPSKCERGKTINRRPWTWFDNFNRWISLGPSLWHSFTCKRPTIAKVPAKSTHNTATFRVAEHLMGVPPCCSTTLAKVRAADKLYSFGVQLLFLYFELSILVSEEDPSRRL